MSSNKNESMFLLFKELQIATDMDSSFLKFNSIIDINSHNMPGIYIRSSFKRLVEYIEKEKRRKFLILGDPGIGKTFFSYYFIYYLISQKKSIVYENAINNCIYCFDAKTNELFKASQSAETDLILSNEESWYVIDDLKPSCSIDVKAHTILFTTSNNENFDNYVNFHQVNVYHLPCWTAEELIECKRLCFNYLGDDIVNYLRYKLGPTPRYVLDKAQMTYIHLLLEKSIEMFKLEDLVTDKFSALGSIVHFQVDCQSFQTTELEFSSEYIAQRIVDKYFLIDECQLKSMIKQCLGSKILQPVGRSLFRFYSFLKFTSGGYFKVKDLDSGIESTLLLPCRKRNYFLSLGEIFKNENYKEFCWAKSFCNEQSCSFADAILFPNFFLTFEMDERKFAFNVDAFEAEIDKSKLIRNNDSEIVVNLIQVVTRERYMSGKKCDLAFHNYELFRNEKHLRFVFNSQMILIEI